MSEIKNNKKIINAWVFYDWANSVYPLVITTAIFPIFYEGVTSIKNASGEIINDKVLFFGKEITNTALVSYVTSFMFLLVSIISPILSGIADFTGNRSLFLRIFCYIGSLSCIGLYFFDVNHLEWSLFVYMLAALGYWCSIVFYNSFLPLIADPEHHDKISARGFGMGYFGSALLLIACLALIMTAPAESQGDMTRLAFLFTGIWWFGFSHITFSRLPRYAAVQVDKSNLLRKGFHELSKALKYVWTTKRLKRYLIAFFVYSMGVQTVMIMATYFGTKEVEWGEGGARTGLIVSVLLIQFVAIFGGFLTSKLSAKIGNLKTLMIVLFLWAVNCVSALWVTHAIHFYCIAASVGFVMGGIQSLSRSTYSKFLPETNDTASFFSLYDVAEKIGIVIGTLSYGLIEEMTGSMRNSIVVLIVFFAAGFLLLLLVPENEKIKQSKV